MKLCFIIMLAGLMQVSAKSLAQRISLDKSGATLRETLNEIRKQSGYSVLCDADLLDQAPKITVHVNNVPVDEALRKCLIGQPLTYVVKNNTIIIYADKSETAVAKQAISITGIVTDEKNQPIPGATVKVKGTATVAASDNDGKYKINVADGNATLIFSFIGYASQEITVQNRTQINVTLLEENSKLNEVVVVGYGTQKRSDVVGAISVVSGKTLEDRPLTNALAGLQGAAPGLVVTRSSGQPGREAYSPQIRGAASVNGSSVLILVDGVEQASLTSINPNDIESVSILKDASAAAIYGARAAGGVMLVTTKSGKKGKLTVNYSGLYTLNKPYNMPKRLHSYEEASMQNQAYVNAGQSASYTQQQLDWMKDPGVEYQINTSGQYEWYYDLNQVPILTRSVTKQENHSLTLSGGDEKTQYLFSGGIYNQNGLFKVGADGFNRYNARINLTTNFNKWLSLDAKMAYLQRHIQSPSFDVDGTGGILYNLYIIRSIYPIYLPGSDDSKYANGGSLAYPYLKDGGVTDERTDAVNGVFTLQAKDLVKGLNLRAIYAPYLEGYNYNRTVRTVPLYGLNGVAANLNTTNAYYVTKQNTYRNNLQFLGDYDLNLGADHHFHALAGYQFENYRQTNVAATAKNLSSNELFTLNIGDPSQYSASDNIATWATQSAFGRLSYNYQEKYFAEATGRYDGSSRLAPGYRYKFFPAFSAGWRVSREKWFAPLSSWVDELKLRGSFGTLGNSDLSNFGNYDYIALISRSGAYPFNNQPTYGYYNATLASPYKTWERINTKDIGIDLAFFNNRLNISGDYYVKDNQNMLVTVNTTAMIGIGTSQYNYASLRNKGWEVSVEWRSTIGKDFRYFLRGNLSDNVNRVTSYQGRSVVAAGLNSVIEGMPLNTLWGYKATGLYATNAEVTAGPFVSNTTGAGDIRYQDMNGDNKINTGKSTVADHGDLVNMGSTIPRYTYGFNFGFSLKGLDFSAFLQGVGKRSMLINPNFMLPFVNSWRQPNQEQTDYWTPEHMDAKFPRLYMGGSSNTLTSTWWVQNAAYLRLKNVQLGYTLPSKWTQKIAVKTLRVFFSGQDIWEISNMWLKYYDPEEPNNTSTSYPFFRSYAFGVNLTL